MIEDGEPPVRPDMNQEDEPIEKSAWPFLAVVLVLSALVIAMLVSAIMELFT